MNPASISELDTFPSIPSQSNPNYAQEWVDRTLKSLTLREKIAQTANERLPVFHHIEEAAAWLEKRPLGSVFSGGEIIKTSSDSAESLRAGIECLQQQSKVPFLVAGDLECGAGVAVKGLTRLPSEMALGAANDPALAYEYGKWTAIEGRSVGFTWTFSPVLDLLRNWLNPVVSNRAIGVDPEHVASIACEIIRGLQEFGMAGCAKHWPGDGVDFRDQHLVTSVNSLPEAEWQQHFGNVYRRVFQAGVYTVMPGHIALPWMEPMQPSQRRPTPATVSRPLLTELLRGEFGFDGVIVSDALEMAGFTGWAPQEERLIAAFNAGTDVMLWPGDDYIEIMERALETGRITESRLDESVHRILALKEKLHLHKVREDRADPLALKNSSQVLDLSMRAAETGSHVAERSLTLVRNREHLLPLDSEKTKTILLHRATNPTNGRKDDLAPLVQGLQARGIEVTVIDNGNCLDVIQREKDGDQWDAYLVVFSLQIHQMKNTVRPVGEMGEVMWTLQNTLSQHPIVISCGTPFLLRDMPFLDTLVNTYCPSAFTQEALVKALFGEIPFSSFSPVEIDGRWF